MKLPSELVLLATVHGGIPIQNGEAKTFVVPEGFTITRVMATRPGICNVTSEAQVDTLVKTMNTNPEETFETMKITQAQVLKSITQQLKGDDPNNELLKQYIRSRIGSPTFKIFKSGDTMLDKTFVRNPDESMYKAFDFKLNVINMPGIPDLFDLFYFGTSGPAAKTRSKHDGAGVDLSMLVYALISKGVTDLTLYDLTCSSFMGDVPTTERDERRVRRDILQKGMGTRNRKKKTKRRSTRKRTSSKWTSNLRRQ